MNKIFIIYVSIILMIVSCSNIERDNNHPIEVSFYTNLASREFSVSMGLDDMEKQSEGNASDIVFISRKDYNTIKEELMSLSIADNISDFDSRFMISIDTLKICVDYWGERWHSSNGKSGTFDSYLLYRIKCLSNYYNYSTRMDIEEDRLIKKYGMPDLYKYKGFEDSVKERPIGFAKVKLLPN